MKVGIISQYTEVYCDCRARARLDCIAIQCLAKPRYSKGWARSAGAPRRWGVGLRRGERSVADARDRGEAAAHRARGNGALGAQAAGGRRAGGRRMGALGARQGAAGARAGRAGWLWAMHSVHSACFRSGLTRYCS